ncbi:MAG: hypothetical protein WC993_07030 [Methanoculleus sp.]
MRLRPLAQSGDVEEKSVAEDAIEKIRMVRGGIAEPSAPRSR